VRFISFTRLLPSQHGSRNWQIQIQIQTIHFLEFPIAVISSSTSEYRPTGELNRISHCSAVYLMIENPQSVAELKIGAEQ
jgi:hypothetical protein